MPQQQTKKGANKIKRAGARKGIIERYYASTYPRTKIRRIFRNNGIPAAQSWADAHGCNAIYLMIGRQIGLIE
jgi:hypothetical protein